MSPHSWRRLYSQHSSSSKVSSCVEQYRQVMSSVAQAAMIITTNHMDQQRQPEPRGLTVSSVTSLSIKPEPALSFNIQVPSQTSRALHDSMVFALNILPPSKSAVEICKAFAGSLGKDVNPFEVEKSLLRYESNGMPVVSIAMAVLMCEATNCFSVQDHEIWVARVTNVELYPSLARHEGNLLYQNHRFHELGQTVD